MGASSGSTPEAGSMRSQSITISTACGVTMGSLISPTESWLMMPRTSSLIGPSLLRMNCTLTLFAGTPSASSVQLPGWARRFSGLLAQRLHRVLGLRRWHGYADLLDGDLGIVRQRLDGAAVGKLDQLVAVGGMQRRRDLAGLERGQHLRHRRRQRILAHPARAAR